MGLAVGFRAPVTTLARGNQGSKALDPFPDQSKALDPFPDPRSQDVLEPNTPRIPPQAPGSADNNNNNKNNNFSALRLMPPTPKGTRKRDERENWDDGEGVERNQKEG